MFEKLNIIKDIMKMKHDKNISDYNQTFLSKTLERRMKEIKIISEIDYCNFLENSKIESNSLYDLLNNNYSRFFRDSLVFALLERNIFPKIIERKTEGSEIRIWSAGCSHGQEPYSIAIMLSELLENIEKKLKVRIFATDISEKALAKGISGVYSKNDIEDIKTGLVSKYFINNGNKYNIDSKIKKMVNFSYYNLLNNMSKYPPESIYGDFDIVICSNLIFYYDSNLREKMIFKLENSIKSEGYFITGESEKNFVKDFTSLKNVNTLSSIFKKFKGGKRQ